MASDNVAKQYWFADERLRPATPAPAAAFTATPASGTAPLPVSFNDISTGAPTAWSWTFGDGGTSTALNPVHTYSTAGTYGATLTATNSGGSSSSNSPQHSVHHRVFRHRRTAAGYVLIASITADLSPSMTSVPADWTAIVNGLGINSSSTSGARVF